VTAGAPPDISVVVVNWNTSEMLARCLASLETSRGTVGLEVIVVDNGSTDGSLELVRRAYPTVQLIANPDNRGFSAANNQGIKGCSGRYIFLLNSDTEVEGDSLRALVDYGDAHTEAGIMGPRLLNSDGTLQPSGGRFPTLMSTMFDLAGAGRYGTRRDYSKPAVVDEVSGAAMLVRREVIEQVGSLDEAFVWGYEDLDLCLRAHRAGWQVHYVPAATVRHEWGASRRLAPTATVLMAINGRRHYFRKHYGPISSALVIAATFAAHLLRSVVFAVGGLINRRLLERAAIEWEIVRKMIAR